MNAQGSISTLATNDNALLNHLKASQLTVNQLVNALASPNSNDRNNAVVAISALRNHYIDEAGHIAMLNIANRTKDDVTSVAFDTAAFLRPSDPNLLQEADQNITFSPTPGFTASHFQVEGYPAARLLIRASYAALPTFRKDFTTSIVQPNHPLTKSQTLRLQCVDAILTTSAPKWFHDLAASEHDVAIQKSLLYCSKIISLTPPNPPGAPPPPPSANFSHGRGILTGFLEANAIDEELDTDDLDQIDPSKYVIKWDAPLGLADDVHRASDPPIPPWPNEQAVGTIIASHDIERTIALLSYTICLRLNADPNIKTKQNEPPFSESGALDAISALGNLRSTSLAPYDIWQYLRRTSLKHHLENDTSLITRASLTSLGQIDVPATRLLTTRIGYELSPEQQRAAAYTIGEIMGKYAVPYLNDSLILEQTNMTAETNQGYKPEFQDRITNLKNMLALGEEKKWFEGDYYGAQDPHAYNLALGSASAPAKMSNL